MLGKGKAARFASCFFFFNQEVLEITSILLKSILKQDLLGEFAKLTFILRIDDENITMGGGVKDFYFSSRTLGK